MSKPFKIGQGNTPKLVDTLSDESGVVDVTGMTVKFILQGPGVSFTRDGSIEDGPNGKVSYQFVAEDAAVPGDYQAQWQLTAGSVTRTYPGEGYIQFSVNPALPLGPQTGMGRLADFLDDVRAVLGDHKGRRYQDSSLEKVMRVVLRGGQVPGYVLGNDRKTISPAIPNEDVTAYMLFVLHTAKMVLMPNARSSGYSTRALKERFGDQKDFIFDLEQQLFELENGAQTYSNVCGVRRWLFELSGLTDNSRLLFPLNWFFPETIYL